MGGICPEDQYKDTLLRKCISCKTACKQRQVIPRCISYCEKAHCKILPGHYYDLLLKKCLRCADVCGSHPAECSLHCHVANTRKLLVEVTSHPENNKCLSVPTALEDSTILLYSLVALCIMLLLSSLSLALAVLVRGAKAKTSNQRPKEARQQQGRKEVTQPERSSKGFQENSNHPSEFEPTYDSSPTETCVCVHCFPDLKALSQGNQRAPYSVHQQPSLHRAQTLKPGPVWTEQNLQNCEHRLQEEAAVG
ncbi:hypothetical protein PBY51_001335 [Eleginops maclovinus]|uniref:TNFR-Cys domain-containing protein n=1 Tax=Eleginops maclovinus TaxID=56733 RepID=A0AAN7WXM9_ELEMC|nr:hypothetical protein PBY51_001335 [Eleginops maclovinus]